MIMNLRTTSVLLLAVVVCLLFAASFAMAQVVPPEVESVPLTGQAAGDNFGKSAALVGDVTGDGIGDVAIGAPYADDPADAAGAVLIYAGSTQFFNDQPWAVLIGRHADEHFGIAIASGDFNGDGINDLAVGARFNNLRGRAAGAVYIFLGGPSLRDNDPWLILTGEVADDWFGQSVGTGDFNGDGFADVVVGAPYNDASANAAGRAYIYFGGPNMNATPDLILDGPSQSNAHFGWAVAGGGDVNGDGFDDVIVGARLFGQGQQSAAGRCYIYFGGTNMNNTPDVILDGEGRDHWFGDAVAGAGDVNGDGTEDVIVGAKFAGSGAGAAYLFLGGDPMSTSPALKLADGGADAQFGFSVGGGDVDGDGISDMIVGAHFADGVNGRAAGKAFVYYGSADPNATADIVIEGEAAHDQLGESVAAGGSVTPDEKPAFLVGAHHNDAGGPGAGRAYVMRVGEPAPGPSITVTGTCPGTVTVAWSGTTPGRQAGLLFAVNQGNFVISGGPCDGTRLGLGTNQLQLVRTFSTGATGSGQFSGQAGSGACGRFLQVVIVDASPCTTTNVAQIP